MTKVSKEFIDKLTDLAIKKYGDRIAGQFLGAVLVRQDLFGGPLVDCFLGQRSPYDLFEIFFKVRKELAYFNTLQQLDKRIGETLDAHPELLEETLAGAAHLMRSGYTPKEAAEGIYHAMEQWLLWGGQNQQPEGNA